MAVVVQCVGLSVGLIAVFLALAAGWTFIQTVCIAILAGNAGVFLVVAVSLVRAWRRGAIGSAGPACATGDSPRPDDQ